jgi:uncharacterized glyoxalase superfamily protein PhnB
MDVYPTLTYRDVDAALAFLTVAFGLEIDELDRDDMGAVRSASVRAGEGRVLIQQDLPAELHGTHLGQGWIYVTVPNADAHFARARDAGALVLSDPHGSPDGTFRGYSARDPEGNLWSFGTDRPGG